MGGMCGSHGAAVVNDPSLHRVAGRMRRLGGAWRVRLSCFFSGDCDYANDDQPDGVIDRSPSTVFIRSPKFIRGVSGG